VGTDVNSVVERELLLSLKTGEVSKYRSHFGPKMKEAFSEAKLTALFSNLKKDLGEAKKITKSYKTQSSTITSVVEFASGQKLDFKHTYGVDQKIWGLGISPTRASADQKHNQVPLIFPMLGEVFIFKGGDTSELNPGHHDFAMQRHALDVVIKDSKGRTHKGTGKALEDYYCFGAPILAPSPGVVTSVIRGIEDNRPSKMNPWMALGNSITIKHTKTEFSLLAHLKKGSIKVEEGDEVSAGQTLAQCGNSGNSSEPHLHYQLQDTSDFADSLGIKMQFKSLKVRREGKSSEIKENYSPIRGDFVENK
jgi:hypothetical protein